MKRDEAPPSWRTRGVTWIGVTSFLSDTSHEVPTSLLPRLVTSVLGASAATLGIIEGVSDWLAGISQLLGGALSDDPDKRRAVATGGYATTAVLSSLIGVAATPWQVGVLRAGAWGARGLRSPARNALLADAVAPEAYGRAYGFERAMDNSGAIAGPLLALVLVALLSIRTAILLSIVPGLLAAVTMALAVGAIPKLRRTRSERIRLKVRPLMHGAFRRLMFAVAAFETANVATTLLILRATDVFRPSLSADGATQAAIALYLGYNVAASLSSYPAGRMIDRIGPMRVFGAAAIAFALGYVMLAWGAVLALVGGFVLAGVGIACGETAQSAAVASLAPVDLRGSAFGLLAGVRSFGNLAASAVAGILWTALSPAWAFLYLAVLMAASLLLLPWRTKPSA